MAFWRCLLKKGGMPMRPFNDIDVFKADDFRCEKSGNF